MNQTQQNAPGSADPPIHVQPIGYPPPGYAPPGWGPPPNPYQDAEHLKLLSIFYYVAAGLSLLALLGLLAQAVFMTLLFRDFGPPGSSGAPEPFFGFFYVVFILFGALTAVVGTLQLMTANGLRTQRRYGLCFTVAVITCLSIPLGTVLGVFTIIVLNRPGAKMLFGRPTA